MNDSTEQPNYTILSLYNDLLIHIFDHLDLISKIRFIQIKPFRFLKSRIAHLDKFNDVHNKISSSKVITKAPYLKDKTFIKNNKFYQNLNIKKIKTFYIDTGIGGPYKKLRRIIDQPEPFYKQGFTNIRCNHQHIIKHITLYCGGNVINKIINFGGVFLNYLRKIYGIEDPSIIPLITDKFIPFMERYNFYIEIQFNKDVEMDKYADWTLSCEIVQIDEPEYFMTFQFDINLWSILHKNNQNEHKELSKIINIIEYIAPGLIYSGKQLFGQNASYKINFDGIIQYLILYCPNKLIKKSICKIFLDKNEEIEIPTIMKNDKQFTILNFFPCEESKQLSFINNSCFMPMITKYGINMAYDLKINLYLEFEMGAVALNYMEIIAMTYDHRNIANGTLSRHHSVN